MPEDRRRTSFVFWFFVECPLVKQPTHADDFRFGQFAGARVTFTHDGNEHLGCLFP